MAVYSALNPKALQPDINPADRNNYAIQAGYTGWEDYLNNANKERQGGGGTNASIGTGGSGVSGLGSFGASASTPDLKSIYEGLYNTSGIKESEAALAALTKKLTDRQQAQADAAAKINDNPFYSEGTRVGRIAKLDQIANADQTVIQNEQKSLADQIATKKADIETALNIQLKQFDLNSQAATQALNQFNTLLSSGALDNASAEDIATLTRTTGMPSSFIASAVNATKQKNIPTSTISFDDGTNQGFAIINTQTGEIIKKETIAQSKPAAPRATTENEMKTYYSNALRKDAAGGAKLSQIFSIYTGLLDPDLIYQLYNASSKYGPDKGDISALAKYGVRQPTGSAVTF